MIKLSVAWDDGDATQREHLYNEIKKRPGVKWAEYADLGGDYLNCMALGLLGSNEPQFELTLSEVIAARSDEPNV